MVVHVRVEYLEGRKCGPRLLFHCRPSLRSRQRYSESNRNTVSTVTAVLKSAWMNLLEFGLWYIETDRNYHYFLAVMGQFSTVFRLF